jgi:ferric-dicitrate binding protein FerR (iron transport regulator)
LKGEAYFEVEPDPGKPFVVEIDNLDVTVLGTKFNVNGYASERALRTTLVQGSVQVSEHHRNQALLLQPNQQATYQDGILSAKEVDASAFTAWMEGRFYFESTPLKEIAAQLERWYDLDFLFEEEALERYEFTGVIRRDYTANQIIEIIEKTTDVKFRMNGRTVTVYV